ncbi:MAG: hypothetical protein H0U71_01495 [Gammaproteobacteria bacterium]|nr:hypothetical protein [Gammaproteobacteria bacterium]
MNNKAEVRKRPTKPPRADKLNNIESLVNFQNFLLILQKTLPQLKKHFNNLLCTDKKLEMSRLKELMTEEVKAQFAALNYDSLFQVLQHYKKLKDNSAVSRFAQTFASYQQNANNSTMQMLEEALKNAIEALTDEIQKLAPNNASTNKHTEKATKKDEGEANIPVINSNLKSLPSPSQDEEKDYIKEETPFDRLKPLFQEIEKVAQRLDRESHHFFSIGRGKKAQTIRTALQNAKSALTNPMHDHFKDLNDKKLFEEFLDIHPVAQRSLKSALSVHRVLPQNCGRSTHSLLDIENFIKDYQSVAVNENSKLLP